MKAISDDLSKLAEITLRMATVIDRDGENRDLAFPDKLGYGYLALTSYLRAGIKAMIDLQNEVSDLKSKLWYTKESGKDMRELLREIFGQEDVVLLNDEAKQKIKDLVATFFEDEDDTK